MPAASPDSNAISAEPVTLGRTGIVCSRLGAGCSQIASLSSRHAPAEIKATLHAAFDAGITFYDTADVYGQGDSERMLGRELGKHRETLVLCTKAGLRVGSMAGLIRLAKPLLGPLLRRVGRARAGVSAARIRAEQQCFTPAYLRACLASSLRRLRTDHVDVFLLHSPPPGVIRAEETSSFLRSIVASGLARAAGVSLDHAEDIRDVLAMAYVDCVQVPVNMLDRETLRQGLPLLAEAGIGVIARSPFGGGAVFSDAQIAALCHKLGRPPTEVALRCLADKEYTGVILAGMTNREHLVSNIDALASAPLDPEVLAEWETRND